MEGAIDADLKTGWAVSPQNKLRATGWCSTLEQQFGNQHKMARFRLSATDRAAVQHCRSWIREF